MPRNKFQKIIFGVIMSYAMAFGMELYNTAINMGIALQPGGLSHMTWTAVGTGMKEMLIMGIFVLIVSELFGNRMGQRFMQKHTTESDSPYFHQLMRQAENHVKKDSLIHVFQRDSSFLNAVLIIAV